MSLDSETDQQTRSERILDRLRAEDPMLNVLAARPRAGASLENELARQLARMANGEAVLQAMATEYQVRIRYRMPHTPRKGKEEAELHAQLLAAAAQFFERVENRRAALASARDSPATSKVL